MEPRMGSTALTNIFTISPDKNFILTRSLMKPFSYLVTANGFASLMQVLDKSGALVKTIAQLPSSEGTASCECSLSLGEEDSCHRQQQHNCYGRRCLQRLWSGSSWTAPSCGFHAETTTKHSSGGSTRIPCDAGVRPSPRHLCWPH